MNQKLGLISVLLLLGIVFFSFMGLRTEHENYIPFQKAISSLAQVENMKLDENSRLLDQNGNLLYEFKNNESRIYLDYNRIPEPVRQVFIATEDQGFIQHHGIDGKAIARAFITNSSAGSVQQGGSTITQQLSRNLFLTHERTYDRKLKELLISYQIEQQLSKERILELYINSIYFQNGVYGIEKASRYYFSKPVGELSLAETALLAAIPNNPKLYDPLTNFENTIKRQKWILLKMKEQGYINEATYEASLSQHIQLKVSQPVIPYPEIVGYVKEELLSLLATSPANKGLTTKELLVKRDQLLKSGVVVETSLDPLLQKEAVRAVNNRLPYNDIEGSVVVVDHVSKQIVSIVGGKNVGLEEFNRAYQAKRQPGSSIKPLLVYAPYVDVYGAKSQSLISAARMCEDNYCPNNYGGASYGTVSLKKAIASSINTAAVRVLSKTGVNKAFSYLQPFGFSSVTREDHQLASALGGFSKGFSPLELTSAYTAFSSGGTFVKPRLITSVKDKNGKLLYAWKEKPVSVWSEKTNSVMREMLEAGTISGTARDARFAGSSYIGGKTGTTNDVRDLWFIGLTDRYTAGVWVGRDKPSSLRSIESASPEVMIWRDIMKKAHQN
ncbi:transglycosylase domain-containing protein [Fictibacillus norfolkensis]|uniref:Penicillin-binding protein n=1 Tax=Fictibacillus norfolkensis TaxID=2762233 RepID=A0ABR8SPI6_9BACL|nr:transglycosylase domain-containing protein [Fictibacillus norfolkensis]MBD7965405.1 penicillin-binding protein [Fictibacillus norfolkensis]